MSRFHPSTTWQNFSSSKKTTHTDHSFDDAPDSSAAGDTDNDERLAGCDTSNYFATTSLASPQTFFVPIHYESNYRYPLIVWLHSDGFNENQVDHVMPHVSTRNYLATGVRGTRAADSVGHRFDWHDSTAAVDAAQEKVMCAVDEACQRYSVHQERIVLAGYRTGGTMAMRIAMREPERFAAVASLGGRLPRAGKTMTNLHSLRDRGLPMLWQVACNSPCFDAKALKADIRAAMLMRAKVEIRQYDNDDEMNTAALSDFNHWIMSRVVSGQPLSTQSWQSSPRCFSSN